MFCEKCGREIPEKLDYCPTCRASESKTKSRSAIANKKNKPSIPVGMTKSRNNTKVSRDFEDAIVMPSKATAKNGQNKCPKCGATEISLIKKTGKLRCHFCRHDFDPEKFKKTKTDISQLEGLILGSGTQDIIADSKDILTFKCQSCGAEVVIDTNEALQAKCHWCRNMLSVNQQIPNGAVPDMVLPFSVAKADAQEEIKQFVEEREFFAHPQFKKQFCTENIMAVYLPYMVVDINAHAKLSGQGEVLIRKYSGGHKNNTTYYDADLYNVGREFDLIINGLTIEASKEKLQHLSGEATNNIINAIKPFDTDNSVNWNPNYLRGCTSEKRDVNVEQLSSLVDTKASDIARFNTNSTLKKYNRGVRWGSEELKIKGKQWKAAYLPVWLYSYQSVKGDKKVLHYVAVNARSKKTMGSVPVNKVKLFIYAIIIQIICTIIGISGVVWLGEMLAHSGEGMVFSLTPLILLAGGPFFYYATYAKYRNLCARHRHEEDTKMQMKNLKSQDVHLRRINRLRNKEIEGMNNQNISNERKKWYE